MELEDEAFLDEGAGASAEIAGSGRGNRFHRAVKWEIATQRADMHEPGGISAWKNGHAREADFARLRLAKRVQQRFLFRAKGASRFDHEVGADQTARLFVDRLGEAVA